ncbi:MAG: hypothetical protein CME16_00820 [Gemmatimonadetes bacterium]|nr:hypothetical protein [Gemmatimonadota bacterium]|tara:strand:+ start:135 stop:323 length:189 start_codon:yes stop_codon:yes gene_type:complete
MSSHYRLAALPLAFSRARFIYNHCKKNRVVYGTTIKKAIGDRPPEKPLFEKRMYPDQKIEGR